AAFFSAGFGDCRRGSDSDSNICRVLRWKAHIMPCLTGASLGRSRGARLMVVWVANGCRCGWVHVMSNFVALYRTDCVTTMSPRFAFRAIGTVGIFACLTVDPAQKHTTQIREIERIYTVTTPR